MRQVTAMIISSAMGSALTLTVATTFLSKSFANPPESVVRQMLENGECKVEVGFPEYTVNNRCLLDKVMVGTYSGNLYCATLTVTCGQSGQNPSDF